MLQLPSGWRCTVRALQGWVVEVIRQLCDILFWCLAVWAPRGPSPPHLLIPSWNTWGQTSSDEELVAVDHKKNISAMSHKEKKGKWNKGAERGGGWRWEKMRTLIACWWMTKIKASANKSKGYNIEGQERRQGRNREIGREIAYLRPNGSYIAPAVTIKQQVDAIIKPGRYKQESQLSQCVSLGARQSSTLGSCIDGMT